MHLERALEQAGDLLSTKTSTKRQKNQLPKIRALLHNLETDASDRGQTGLVISLYKPFRRLLRYPQLFQAVLSHTNKWMFEYEGALQLVAEMEAIVRVIEGGKIQQVEHEGTRDILARIKGLDKVIQIAIPKPSRCFVEERLLSPGESGDAKIARAVRRKGPFELSSDVLRSGGRVGISNRKDVWLVVFNDVVLRCQRIGSTSNPLGGRRNFSSRPRNLYKFIKVSVVYY